MVRASKKYFLGFVTAVIVLIQLLISTITYDQFKRLYDANHWVEHSQLIISETNNLMYNIYAAETAQRGYLLTDKENYLSQYKNSIKNIQDSMIVLTRINIHDNGQQKQLSQLSPLINERLAMFTKVQQALAIGNEKRAENLVVLETAKGLTEEIYNTTNKIITNENYLLQERKNTFISKIHFTNELIILMSVLAILIIISFYLFLSISLRKKSESETKEKEIKNILKSTLESTNDAIAALNKNFKFTIFNRNYEERFEQIFGKKITIGMDLKKTLENTPQKHEHFLEIWQRALSGEEFSIIEQFNDPKKGTIYYEITSTNLKDAHDNIVGAMHVARDITTRMESEAQLKQTNEMLQNGLKEIAEKNQQIMMLSSMTEALQSCGTMQDALSPMNIYLKKILYFTSGILYLTHKEQPFLEMQLSWNNPSIQEPLFTAHDCWALRNGHMHKVMDPSEDLLCSHVANHGVIRPYICIPLIAQSHINGLLYLELDSNVTQQINDKTIGKLTDDKVLLITSVSEQIALALGSIKLRETLHDYSIRDTLTGLYNRRFLHEFMFKELHRAKREQKQIAVIMFDIDFFKKFNDEYGHEMGDIILKRVATILQTEFRDDDITARYGGEEFMAILYNTDKKAAITRSEYVRKLVSELDIKHGAKSTALTISAGIAMYPEHGIDMDTLFKAADDALYQAKNSGRNKTVMYQANVI